MRIIEANCVFGRWPHGDRDASLDRLLAALAELGVSRALAVSLRGIYYSHEEGNAETLRTCTGSGMLVPVATVCVPAYGDADSLPRRLVGEGFRMLRLFPDLQGWSTTNILVERLLGECAEAGLPVAVSVVKQEGVASALARLAPRECRVILSDVYYNTLAECAEALSRRGEFLMEVGRTSMPYSLEFLARRVGAERLVLGTRQPLEIGRGAIEMVRDAELPDGAKAAILGGNLSGLLGGI